MSLSKSIVFSTLLLLFFQFSLSWANEGAAKPAEGAKEETAATTGPIKADEWQDLNSKVMTLKSKIKARQDNLKKLIEEKQLEKNPQKVAEIIKSMIEEHKGLEKEAIEYNQQNAVLKYRFPEKSLAGEKRKYERVEVIPLEQLENQMTLEARIKKTLAKAKQQFPNKNESSESEEPANESSPLVKKKKQKQVHPQSPTNLTEPVILEK